MTKIALVLGASLAFLASPAHAGCSNSLVCDDGDCHLILVCTGLETTGVFQPVAPAPSPQAAFPVGPAVGFDTQEPTPLNISPLPIAHCGSQQIFLPDGQMGSIWTCE